MKGHLAGQQDNNGLLNLLPSNSSLGGLVDWFPFCGAATPFSFAFTFIGMLRGQDDINWDEEEDNGDNYDRGDGMI